LAVSVRESADQLPAELLCAAGDSRWQDILFFALVIRTCRPRFSPPREGSGGWLSRFGTPSPVQPTGPEHLDLVALEAEAVGVLWRNPHTARGRTCRREVGPVRRSEPCGTPRKNRPPPAVDRLALPVVVMAAVAEPRPFSVRPDSAHRRGRRGRPCSHPRRQVGCALPLEKTSFFSSWHS